MKTKLLTFAGLILALFGFYLIFPSSSSNYRYLGPKIKGLSFVAPPQQVGDTCFSVLKSMNSDWVSLMPYSFLPKDGSEIQFVTMADSGKKARIWWGETPWGVKECIKMARKNKHKIMLKPHMWLGWGEFTGNLAFDNEQKWRTFEQSYARYLLTYAQIASEMKVELLCIGTELENFVKERPDFWRDLIVEIRKIYNGKLTYAENWDCFDEVPFWSDLDYIGVDAYFPLSKKQNPDLDELKNSWAKHQKLLLKVANRYQKPVLFTEIGYKSNDFAAHEPWSVDFSKPENEVLQDNAYKAMFEQNWNQPYLAGIFVWKWFASPQHNSKRHRDTFAVQGKSSQKTIADYFGR